VTDGGSGSGGAGSGPEGGAATGPPADLGLVYVDDLDRPTLADDDHHHLARVRRLRPGQPIVVGDGAGRWRTAAFGPAPEPTGPIERAERPAPEVGVAFALVKGAKPELAVQKLTELGVDRIVPFVAARSVVRWDQAKADAGHRRLERVAREAAMQSRQAWIPTVEPVASFAAVADRPGASLAERGGDGPTLDRPFLLVGPEGGWDPSELAVDLPRTALAGGVLRAETAAIVAGSLLVALRAGLVAPGR
jgi:16S rRNA (uracil1498-N3)-methyltransferase